MKKLIQWLKSKGREWCAPGYAAALTAAHCSRSDAEHLQLVVNGYESEVATIKAYVRELETKLRAPFEARESESAPAWDHDDSTQLRAFLATPSGQRLAQVVNWWSQMEEHKASLAIGRHDYACGGAKGFRVCGEFILQRLSADVRPQQDENTQVGNGAAAERERYAP